MTATAPRRPESEVDWTFDVIRLPRQAPLLVAVVATAAAALLVTTLGGSWPLIPILAVLVTDVALPLWSRAVEGSRAAMDRLVTCLVWTAVLCAMVPLVWVLATTVVKGLPVITGDFLTHDMVRKLDPTTFKMTSGGGVLHAVLGTLMVTLGATVISVPIGLMTAIYLVEYGAGSKLARTITILVDVMTGIPSIVAGLFALSLFTVLFGPGIRMGIMGSVALSLLMIPTVVRSAEEMMRLVPADLREAAYALGVPKWRTIVKVVLPTALGGIVTGITLAIARVAGETAPLLVSVGIISGVNVNLFHDRMATLPVFIISEYKQGPAGETLAWGAALLLIVLVMALNLTARLIGKIFAPKTGK